MTELDQTKELAITSHFATKINTFFKYHWQYMSNDFILEEVFNDILNKAKKKEVFEEAEGYSVDNQLNGYDNLFYKYPCLNGLHIIFVVCEKCGGSLRCSKKCAENPGLVVCFQDLWLEN